jgi:hypothetical protein
VEQLKEKIDVLLGKIEAVQRTKLDLKQFNELAEIKKKYAEVNKKCVKEYIGVCQQSLDLYERITGRHNR